MSDNTLPPDDDLANDTDPSHGAAQSGLPRLRLKPKAEARAIRHGFPWVYADEVVSDRRTMAIAVGAFAVLEDAICKYCTWL